MNDTYSDIAASLRASGLGPAQRASLLALVRAEVENQLESGATLRPTRGAILAVAEARRLGVEIGPQGISRSVFDTMTAGKDPRARMNCKGILHFAGLLFDD
jgi:hypothetical protein